jgi:LPS O-antigen subunit length determinant protein (WzzB/FepE family)
MPTPNVSPRRPLRTELVAWWTLTGLLVAVIVAMLASWD